MFFVGMVVDQLAGPTSQDIALWPQVMSYESALRNCYGIPSKDSGSCARCACKLNIETPALRDKGLFDLAKVRGQESKISQIHLCQKAKGRSFYVAKESGRRGSRDLREKSVSS